MNALDQWIAGEKVVIPDIIFALSKAAKANEILSFTKALDHLQTMEDDFPNWLLYAWSIVRCVTNKCDPDTINELAPQLSHIRDVVMEYNQRSSFNPVQYKIKENPLETIPEDITKVLPDL